MSKVVQIKIRNGNLMERKKTGRIKRKMKERVPFRKGMSMAGVFADARLSASPLLRRGMIRTRGGGLID